MKTKACIWCSKIESIKTTFNKKAHTIPQSLQGKFICDDVCDACNSYFGSYGSPSVEVVFKEAFVIASFKINSRISPIGKNKNANKRFSSFYFDYSKKTNSFTTKFQFKIRPNFLNKLARQFKRGVYKVFLEELHRQHGFGFDERFNFIKSFARYDLEPELNVFILEMRHPAVWISSDFIDKVQIVIDDIMLERINKLGFAQFDFWGTTFCFPVAKNANVENYKNYIAANFSNLYGRMLPIKSFLDIDINWDRIKN